MLDTVVMVVTGLLSIAAVGIPVYYKWKSYKDAYEGKSKTISISNDDPRRFAWRDRMRERLPNNRKGTTGNEEEGP